LFLGIVLITSCKNKQEVVKEIERKLPTYDVIVDVIIPSDEELILLYKNGPGEFVDSKTVWLGVKGSEASQTLVFSLPEGVMPTDFRLDIGRNEYKGLKSLEIKKISLRYENRRLDIRQEDVNKYFQINKYIGFDQSTKKYSFSKGQDGSYDPYFLASPLLYSDIKKIAGYTF
jgi:hypothetical protein